MKNGFEATELGGANFHFNTGTSNLEGIIHIFFLAFSEFDLLIDLLIWSKNHKI
jgi:hypothetical protein